jgi:uncharacterized protein (TIGR02284 family)
MTDHSERAVLNHLIETCKDAERGFRHVAEHVTDPYVKALFLDIASQRERFAADLLPHTQRLGGANAGDGTAVGALHRTWIDLRSAVFRGDPAGIVHEAARGERFSRSVYEGALAGVLPPTARAVVERQYAELRRTAKRLRELDVSTGCA